MAGFVAGELLQGGFDENMLKAHPSGLKALTALDDPGVEQLHLSPVNRKGHNSDGLRTQTGRLSAWA